MDRNKFLKALGLGLLSGFTMTTKEFEKWTDGLSETGSKMPVLFVGHGSPMNAIEDNDFTRSLKALGRRLPRPKAILVLSAHWLTRGTRVQVVDHPPMVYDMYGFPKELYEVKYPAPGAPALARETARLVKHIRIEEDHEWGFDHGNWSVLRHLFPQADIPVFQLSIDYYKSADWHYELARELRALRRKGVLIIGSGNLTHNLRMVDFHDLNAPPRDWALEFDNKVKEFLESGNARGVVEYEKLGQAARLAVPEPSHYLPLVYTVGLQETSDEISFPYDKFHYGTLSMRSVLFS
ncbi:MAG: 4,5-DOPA dioxygenase extradiol [Saprospirales bacterium]|nr:4,5-DOPA dioxygenase extradiol [Saprospirales bacterium]